MSTIELIGTVNEAGELQVGRVSGLHAGKVRVVISELTEAGLALTDVDLSERFWLIDLDGIPRLKGDEAHLDEKLLQVETSLNGLWLAWQRGEKQNFPSQAVMTTCAVS